MFTLRKLSSASLFLAASLTTCFCQTPATATTAHRLRLCRHHQGSLPLRCRLKRSAYPGLRLPVFHRRHWQSEATGNTFVSLGTDYVHSYSIASNGAIGKQASQINTQSYSGSTCGTMSGAASITPARTCMCNSTSRKAGTACTALQSFKISTAERSPFWEQQSSIRPFNPSEPTRIALTGSDAFGTASQAKGSARPLLTNSSARAAAR